MTILGEAATVPPNSLRAFLWPLAVSFGVTVVATPVIRGVAIKLDLYDRPDAGLKPHQRPIPYLGGVAMYLGWLAALASSLYVSSKNQGDLFWIALAGTLMMATGLIDDVRHLRPRTRLLVQAAAAGLLLLGDAGRRPASALAPLLQAALPAAISTSAVVVTLGAVFCIVAIAGATNSTNLIDGLDGLCSGVLAIAAIGFFAVSGLMFNELVCCDESVFLRAPLCAAMLGACLGFLVYNFNPATIFMGDSGSLLLGFNVAVMMILFAGAASWKWFAASLVVFAFPIFDTFLAIARRKLHGRPLFVGDRSHFYDQVRDRGLSVRRTVLICYLLGVVFAGLGVAMLNLPPIWRWSIFAATPAVAAAAARRFGLLRVDDAHRKSQGHSAP